MDIVFNNPYRILGLLADSTTREKERQINRLRLLMSILKMKKMQQEAELLSL